MSGDPIGSLAEEAAKFVSALSSAQSSSQSSSQSSQSQPGTHDESHDPSSPECRYCPFCALARTARSMTPEVREHLTSAATSLVLALKGLLDEAVTTAPRTETPVENIDLAED